VSLIRRAVAEFLGTGFLVAAEVGSGIMGERLAAGRRDTLDRNMVLHSCSNPGWSEWRNRRASDVRALRGCACAAQSDWPCSVAQ
jgi:hypothetical protein